LRFAGFADFPIPAGLSPVAVRVPLHHARAAADHEAGGVTKNKKTED